MFDGLSVGCLAVLMLEVASLKWSYEKGGDEEKGYVDNKSIQLVGRITRETFGKKRRAPKDVL